MSAPALPCSPHVSAGISPPPGAYARVAAWWGDADWIAEVRAAVHAHPDVCAAHHVAPGTVLSVAKGMARFADYRTGRDCRPTNARLREAVQVSQSTVQRARRVLRDLGLCVAQLAGRNIMTRAERLTAWAAGSSARAIAATFALCSRSPRRGRTDRRAAPKMSTPKVGEPSDYEGADSQSVDDDHLPGALVVRGVSHLRSTHLRRRTEPQRAAPRPAHTEAGRGKPRRRGSGADPGTRRLAERVARRLRWLAGVPASRITPALHRFAVDGWTDRDVERGVTGALAARGWQVPRELRQPAAYLAGLLRDLDPADRPGALDEHMAAVEAAQRAYERQLIHGAPCAHGTPAGDVPSPLRGLLACPHCRSAAATTLEGWPRG